ncbi:MAG: indolepyruvate ferredoxin oxidoreductase [Bacteroidetes bacterium]|jgi:indolepyruvate ferredoxin oxidoreductase, alpha subunit|nr:indolepyruvate ferredoxin oxidoreductase [Bacteroidota bacterium]MBT6686152.1 indolepyruvate ferredoxin oxidoreductase [Bacteroidota bacterium]MBT7143863.1 indolepyruvate ferredoxin oxidoreductase [Bacteroidota bacterium]MBT7491218.1 indolepyruvate ferredoxin oxidoreductase [Bacteroidota bacterium]
MQKLLVLGAEAIAQGAIDGGMSGIYAYPGTPSTEITEYVQNNKEAKTKNIRSKWSSNEKTAMESALGMSYAGKRAMVCMKHVGLNVAADAFINSAITGSNGGLIVTVADDPSMHSSQNEQDSRFYGKFAMIPIFEPSSQQEAYDMAYEGFQFSEKHGVPVMIRLTTRLSHSRAGVSRKEMLSENNMKLPENKTQFVLLPSIAKKNYRKLLGDQVNLENDSENSIYNKYFDGKDKSLGIIACGLAFNYLIENFPDEPCNHPILKISQYPIPRNFVNKICEECDEVLVLEDGYPLVEELLKGFLEKEKIKGRLDGSIPRDGELNPNIVAKSIGIFESYDDKVPELIENRPPAMCQGCGHIDAYNALNEALSVYETGRVFSDIGCYTLGALPPYNAINSCVDMGASITMAVGASDAGLIPSVSVIGDSTFTHSGITGLLDAVNNNSPITVLISDNFTTGMTGGQDSSALGKIEDICLGVGVDPKHIRVFTPIKRNHDEMVSIMKEELEYNGVSVIVPRRQCIQTMRNKDLAEQLKELKLK